MIHDPRVWRPAAILLAVTVLSCGGGDDEAPEIIWDASLPDDHGFEDMRPEDADLPIDESDRALVRILAVRAAE